MSTKTTKTVRTYSAGELHRVPRYKCAFVHETNHARVESVQTGESGSGQLLRDSFAKLGWDVHSTNGICLGEPIYSGPIHKDAQWESGEEALAFVMTQRENLHKKYIAAMEAAVSDKDRAKAVATLTAFRTFYCDPENNLLQPELGDFFWMVDGHQRDAMSFLAAVDRLMGTIHRRESENETLPDTLDDLNIIPVLVITFSTESERRIKQIEENERDTVGKTALTDRDALHAAKELFDSGNPQSVFRSTFKVGRAQKLHGFLTLNVLHKAHSLYKRAMLPMVKDAEGKYVPAPRSIKLAGVRHNDLPTYIKRSDPAELERENNKRIAKSRETGKTVELLDPLTGEVLESEIIPMWNGEKRKVAPQSMSRDSMEQTMNATENPMLKRALSAVLQNNNEGFIDLNRHAQLFAVVDAFIDAYGKKRNEDGEFSDPTYVGVVDILRRILNCEDAAKIAKGIAAAQKVLPAAPVIEEEV